jgi:transposase
MKQVTTFVGIDAHKKDLFVAMVIGAAPVPVTWQLANEPGAVRRMVRKLERDAPGPVHVFYEAGPCGYPLQRQIATERIRCDVIAPALMPRKPDERVKTNRRDARKLAELGRAGLLTVVQPPTPADEAVRDLARARDDAREDLQRCRHRLGKLLLRRGLHYAGKNWTQAHRRWIDGLTWTHAAERAVVEDYRLAIDHAEARLLELDARLAELAMEAPYREPVGWLRCFRGIDTLTAMLILAELHDFRRFGSARALMAFLGLVPGEDSSCEKYRRRRITKMGNALVRRVLVEASWHYQHRPGVGRGLKARRTGQSARVIAIADKAQQRLCRRFRRMLAEHKPAPKVAVAVAKRTRRLHLGGVADAGGRVDGLLRSHSRYVGVAKVTDAHWHESEDRRASYALQTSVPTRASSLHVLSTKHCHASSALGDWRNHRISA